MWSLESAQISGLLLSDLQTETSQIDQIGTNQWASAFWSTNWNLRGMEPIWLEAVQVQCRSRASQVQDPIGGSAVARFDPRFRSWVEWKVKNAVKQFDQEFRSPKACVLQKSGYDLNTQQFRLRAVAPCMVQCSSHVPRPCIRKTISHQFHNQVTTLFIPMRKRKEKQIAD
jgi:hypothetical protein